MENGSIKNALANNMFAQRRRKKMRNSLINTDFSLLAPNCMGGILMHDLGLRFLTPTVNLMMFQQEFLQFVLHLEDYLKGDLTFYDDPEFTCPCAHLQYETLEPITIHFTHYKSEKDAREKWKERSERINRDNLFIFIEERDGLSKEDLILLGSIKARGVLAFTAHEYTDLPYCVFLKKYHTDGEVGNILKKNYLDDSREYEKYFDFIKWLNEANGGNYDVMPFVK